MAWLDDSEPQERDEQSANEQKMKLTAFYIGLALAPVMVIFAYLGRFHLGANIFLCLFVNVLAITMRWRLRKYLWFWCVMAIVVGLEVPAVLMIPWPHGWVPGVALLPIGLAGLLIALGAIQVAEKLFGKSGPTEEG